MRLRRHLALTGSFVAVVILVGLRDEWRLRRAARMGVESEVVALLGAPSRTIKGSELHRLGRFVGAECVQNSTRCSEYHRWSKDSLVVCVDRDAKVMCSDRFVTLMPFR